MADLMLHMDDVTVRFGSRAAALTALDHVTVTVVPGRSVGLVGESGSGKSTMAKAVLGIVPLAGGCIRYEGQDIAAMSRTQHREFLRKVQMIPQDPYSSLNPRRTIGHALAEAADPLKVDLARFRGEIVEALEAVRLPASTLNRFPHEFSGGQRQRIAIARALVVRPEVIIADEITSALDVSVQAEVLTLLERLRHELALTIVFISHNLAVVRAVCDDVVVLYRGSVVEEGPVEQVFSRPRHEYTRNLLAAVPGSPGFDIEPLPVAT